MRNFLVIVIGVILLNGLLLYSGGFTYLEQQFSTPPPEPGLRPEVAETFRATLEARVQEEIGVPIEGYEPSMFLQVFPGLTESDFDGVEASIGKYVMENGRLTYESDHAKLIHSAAKAISRRGMETLYHNVAARVGIDVAGGGTLTDVMRVVTSE